MLFFMSIVNSTPGVIGEGGGDGGGNMTGVRLAISWWPKLSPSALVTAHTLDGQFKRSTYRPDIDHKRNT